MTEWLTADDGVRLALRRWVPASPSGTAVVVAHGFTGHRNHPDLVAVSDALAAQGCSVVAYDARGHGESGGTCTLGRLEHLDVAAAVDAAVADADRVVVLGTSMGAIAVLRHAADRPGLAGVVTVSSPARWRVPRTPQGVLSVAFTQTPVGRFVARRMMHVRLAGSWSRFEEPVELVSRAQAPVAVVHGRNDRFISVREAVLLHEAAPEPRRIELVEGMGHAFSAAGLPSVCRAVDWVLAAAMAPATAPTA